MARDNRSGDILPFHCAPPNLVIFIFYASLSGLWTSFSTKVHNYLFYPLKHLLECEIHCELLQIAAWLLNLCHCVTGTVLLTDSWLFRNFNYLENSFQQLVTAHLAVSDYTALLG